MSTTISEDVRAARAVVAWALAAGEVPTAEELEAAHPFLAGGISEPAKGRLPGWLWRRVTPPGKAWVEVEKIIAAQKKLLREEARRRQSADQAVQKIKGRQVVDEAQRDAEHHLR